MFRIASFVTIASLAVGASNINAAPVSVDPATVGSALAGKSSIGVTSSTTTREYQGIGSQNALLPYFSLSANQFYVRGISLGYTAFNTDAYILDVVAIPRFLGFDSDDSPELAGLEGTSYTVHAGTSLTIPISQFQLNTQVVADVLGESGGTEITSTLSRTFSFSKLSVTAAASVNWQDGELVNHYFGVSLSEVTDTREQYSAGATVNFSTSLTTSYPLSTSLTAIGAVSINQFGDEIASSPIVENDQTNAVLLGIVYSF